MHLHECGRHTLVRREQIGSVKERKLNNGRLNNLKLTKVTINRNVLKINTFKRSRYVSVR